MRTVGRRRRGQRRDAGDRETLSTTCLHAARLNAVHDALLAREAHTVADLGCGSGPLLARLARSPRFRHLLGIDISLAALRTLARRLGQGDLPAGGRIRLLHASFTDCSVDLSGFDAALLIETIEHIDPDRLSCVEQAVFARHRPRTVVITTPNRECNDLLGVPRHRLRHPDHRFEWSRSKLQSWAGGVARRNRYNVTFTDIGWIHPAFGGPTQMAVFTCVAGECDRATTNRTRRD